MFYKNTQRIVVFLVILSSYILLNSEKISADTIILKDGQTFENVKTSLRQDHVLVQDKKGKIEKIDLTLVEKILVSEIKKSEVIQEEKKEYKNIKKFYFSINGSSWNSKVSEGINFDRGYSLMDVRTNVVNIDPYFERKYTVNVRTISLNGEYRPKPNFGFSLGLEQNSYSFPDQRISPLIGMNTYDTLNTTQEYQTFSSVSLSSFLINQFGGKFTQSSGKFSIETISISPGVKYYIPISESFFWFVQGGFGFGKSYENGIYTKPLTQTVLLVGTGIQWESDDLYFFNMTLQFRKTDLTGSVNSYHFQEPIFMIGTGFKL
ncbi:hypothetical protein [Leptospira noguchii]|uniref:hypothetical protein n=1 Tax=Leptospira noguchii TaxID=28182 RepID=UPI0007749CB3|nr:hypothetical protein [Leptospira noguchii]